MEKAELIESKVAAVETAADDVEQQEKEIRAKQAALKATKLANRDKGFLKLLQTVVELMAMQKKLGLTFIPLVRKDYIIRETVRWLKKATAQEVDANLGKYLQPLLDAEESSLKVIQDHLEDKTRTRETGADGKVQTLTAWYQKVGDNYIVLERKVD